MNIKVPVSWLREYLKTDVTAKTLANALSLSGPSVERTTKQKEDYIFDIEVTTNRPDSLSVFGIAREANAILKAQNLKSNLVEPKGLGLNLDPDVSKPLTLDVVIKNSNLCPRFTAIVINNVKIKTSPAYIHNRLEASGIRAINNIVDISNYLMLELGQPMHTFDYDKIQDSKMTLRESHVGETIKTLDEATHKLPEGAIVIEDAKKLIDLCGIMGGANSQVTSRTKNVVLFVQAYNPRRIRKTTQALGFRTEAATRFEKGIDLEGIFPALSRAVYLAKQAAGAQIASELIDIYPQKQHQQTIRLNFEKLNNYLGIDLEPTYAARVLDSLGFATAITQNQITAKAPSWRTQDMETDVDLIEEIARIYGYHNLPSKLPSGETPKTGESDLKKVIEFKKSLKFLGLTEIISYSIISKNLLKIAGKSEKGAVELANPLTEEWQFMRPTIIPSLLKVISDIRHPTSDIRLFEIAKTYLPQKNDLPRQDLFLSICLKNSNFLGIKGLVENISDILKREIKWQKINKDHALFDIDSLAEIKIEEEVVGIVGIIKPAIVDKFLLEMQVAATEINLTKVFQHPSNPISYKPLPKYPPVIEDLSVIFAKVLPLEEIIEQIRDSGSPLVKKIELIDVFEDPKLGEDKKSVALRLYFQKPTSTLTTEDANKVKAKIISHLQNKLRAKIRK